MRWSLCVGDGGGPAAAVSLCGQRYAWQGVGGVITACVEQAVSLLMLKRLGLTGLLLAQKTCYPLHLCAGEGGSGAWFKGLTAPSNV